MIARARKFRSKGVCIDAIKPARKKPSYPEHREQCSVIAWARMCEGKYPVLRYLFAIPNGLLGRLSMPQRARAKMEGYKAGPPDLFLPAVIPGSRAGLWIEMKAPDQRTVKGGGLSEAQLEYRVQLLAEGYEHYVCYDSGEAIDALKDYLARYMAARRHDVPRGANRKGDENRARAVRRLAI